MEDAKKPARSIDPSIFEPKRKKDVATLYEPVPVEGIPTELQDYRNGRNAAEDVIEDYIKHNENNLEQVQRQ